MVKNRNQFPVLNSGVYANTAAFGLLSQGLLEWRQEHDLDYLIGGAAMKIETMNLMAATRTSLATFFGCQRERVALVPNFSIGLNMLAEGLDKKAHVLLLEGDYPSLNWPFECRGFKITYTGIGERLEEDIRHLIKQQHIDILALSLVQWLNGILIDMEWLRDLKKEFPELLIIADGTQFCGTREFRFESSGIDVLGASGYKWLLAGSGNGFMLFGTGIEDRISIKTTGFNSAGVNLHGRDQIRFAKYLEPGHLDSLTFGSLNFMLGMLSEIGIEAIGAHNKNLVEKAKSAFSELGLLQPEVVHRKDHSTIFNILGDEQMFQHLKGNRVDCSQRGDGIRLSFHFYNTENDIDSIAELLKTKA